MLQLARQHHEHDDDDSQRDDDGVGEAGQIVADIEEDEGGDGHAHQNGEDERQAIEPALGPQFAELVTMVVFHHQRPHERRDADEREQSGHAIGPPVGQQVAHGLQYEGEHDSRHGDAENGVDECVDAHLAQQLMPKALLLYRRLMCGAHVVETAHPPAGQHALQGVVGGWGEAYHVRREERGDHTHGHDDGVDEAADDVERQAQRGDDEGELANLRHREATAHGGLQRLTAEHEAEGT